MTKLKELLDEGFNDFDSNSKTKLQILKSYLTGVDNAAFEVDRIIELYVGNTDNHRT